MTNEELSGLERKIDELKTLYDNYFAGVERREPLRQREALLADMRRFTQSPGALNTQTQFRFNNLRSRFSTMEALWNRMVRQLEEGAQSKRKAASLAALAPKQARARPDGDRDPLAEPTMRDLHAKYSASRTQNGEPPISFEAMVASLKKQVPAVIERYNCASVAFKVTQKDGKTIIKAVPIS